MHNLRRPGLLVAGRCRVRSQPVGLTRKPDRLRFGLTSVTSLVAVAALALCLSAPFPIVARSSLSGELVQEPIDRPIGRGTVRLSVRRLDADLACRDLRADVNARMERSRGRSWEREPIPWEWRRRLGIPWIGLSCPRIRRL